MILATAMILAFQVGPLSATWFPQPTGDNGLEEYARAADEIANQPFVRVNFDLTWLAGKLGFPQIAVTPSFGRHGALLHPEPHAQTGPVDTGAFLEMGENERTLCTRALDLVHAGNSKALRPLNTQTQTEDLLFDLTPFLQTLGNVALRSSYAEFATGKGSSGTQSLIDFLVLADRLERLSSTGSAVGNEIDGKACTLCATLLKAMSVRDCETLDTSVRRLLQGRPAVEELMASLSRLELERIPTEVDLALKIDANTGGEPIPGTIDDRALAAGIQRLSPTERSDLIAQASTLTKMAYDAFSARFSKPESSWLDPYPSNQLFQSVEFVKNANLATQLAFKVTHLRQLALMRLFMKLRERLRLLDVHAQIRIYEWRHFRLPTSLKEVSPSLAVDPINGLDFNYKFLGSDQYELSSLGTPDTGEIKLAEAPVKPPAMIGKP